MAYSTEAHLRDALTNLIPVRDSLKASGEKSLHASAEELIDDIRQELKRRERTSGDLCIARACISRAEFGLYCGPHFKQVV